jgi:hypothetical protein
MAAGLKPSLGTQQLVDLLGVDEATVRDVLNSWGLGNLTPNSSLRVSKHSATLVVSSGGLTLGRAGCALAG